MREVYVSALGEKGFLLWCELCFRVPATVAEGWPHTAKSQKGDNITLKRWARHLFNQLTLARQFLSLNLSPLSSLLSLSLLLPRFEQRIAGLALIGRGRCSVDLTAQDSPDDRQIALFTGTTTKGRPAPLLFPRFRVSVTGVSAVMDYREQKQSQDERETIRGPRKQLESDSAREGAESEADRRNYR